MSTAQFLVLGALERLGQGSGYDILTELRSRKVENWTDLKPGSIYFALQQLAKGGHLVEVSRDRVGRFPEKAQYQVTTSGQNLFDRLQAELMAGPYPGFFGFKMALKFNRRLSASQIADRADRATEELDSVLAAMERHRESLTDQPVRLEDDSFFLRHDELLIAAEKAWLAEVILRYRGARAVTPGASASS